METVVKIHYESERIWVSAYWVPRILWESQHFSYGGYEKLNYNF